MAYLREVCELLGKENFEKVMWEAKSGRFSTQKQSDLAEHMGRHDSEPNMVFGKHMRRIENNKNTEAYSEIQSILCDWYSQQGFKMSQELAVRSLQQALKEIDMKPLASSLVVPGQVVVSLPANSRNGSRSRSRSRSRERLRDTKIRQHRFTDLAAGFASIVCSKLVKVILILYHFCTWFKKNKRAFLLILPPLVTIGIYIHFACNMGDTVTTTGTSIFPLFTLFCISTHRTSPSNKHWVGRQASRPQFWRVWPRWKFDWGYFLQTEKYTEQHRGFPIQVKTILHICILLIDLL